MFKLKPYSLAVSTTATRRSHLLIVRTTLIMMVLLLSHLWIQSADAQTQAWTCDDISQISRQECDALQTLYDAGFGRDTTHNIAWFSNPNPCSWATDRPGYSIMSSDEIRCYGDGTGRIYSLILASDVASFPSEMGGLLWLQSLNIQHNPKLQQIPVEQLSRLNNLTSLSFYNNNNLTTVPAEIGNLQNLERLNFSFHPMLQEVSPRIGELQALKSLSFWNNPMVAAIPSTIGTLHNLEYLSLNKLAIVNVPQEIGNLTKLIDLKIQNNDNLQSLPAEIGNIRGLKYLVIANNPQLMSVPAELARENFDNIQHYIDVPVEAGQPPIPEPTQPVDPNACPTSGVWPAGCVPTNAPTSTGIPCPRYGVWPAGCIPPNSPPPPTPPTDPSACVIPASGPWPDCATAGDPPPSTTPNDCIIPPSGPWPPCARGGY